MVTEIALPDANRELLREVRAHFRQDRCETFFPYFEGKTTTDGPPFNATIH